MSPKVMVIISIMRSLSHAAAVMTEPPLANILWKIHSVIFNVNVNSVLFTIEIYDIADCSEQ